MFRLAAAEVFDDLVQAEVMLLDVLVADSPNLLNNFIAVHCCDPPIRVPEACKFRDTDN